MNSTREILPPHNADAEKSVLGSVLRHNTCFGDVAQVLQEEDFYTDAHRKVWCALCTLCGQGKPADLVTVAEELHHVNQIKDIGGYAALADLWEAAPTAANVLYYAGIVRDYSILRHLIGAATEILRSAYDRNGSAVELLEQAEKKIFAIAQSGFGDNTVPLARTIDEAYDRFDARSRRGGSGVGVSSGFLDLDNLTAGFQDGELVVLAARPSVGKTTAATCFVRNVALAQSPVFVVSLEQSRAELAERMLCAEASVNSYAVRSGRLSQDDALRYAAAGDQLRPLSVFVDDTPGQGMLRITANARRLKLRHGIRLVLIDYLQLIEPDSRRDSRNEQVGGITRRLKLMARELSIPVICLAQLNRGVEDRVGQRPRLSDIRDSGEVEQHTDTVLFLHREPERENVIELIVAKQRNGPTGEIKLYFRKEYMRFEDYCEMPEFAEASRNRDG